MKILFATLSMFFVSSFALGSNASVYQGGGYYTDANGDDYPYLLTVSLDELSATSHRVTVQSKWTGPDGTANEKTLSFVKAFRDETNFDVLIDDKVVGNGTCEDNDKAQFCRYRYRSEGYEIVAKGLLCKETKTVSRVGTMIKGDQISTYLDQFVAEAE